MTGEQLRDELARIAGSAPEVRVPDDLFARGRRATVRARVLVAAAAVACIGLVVGLGAQVLRSDEAPVANGVTRGVPDVIYAPADGDVGDLPKTTLDDVGPLVAAYLVPDGDRTLVVVDAEGRYRTVTLPSLDASAFGDAVLLAPDGTRLAYYFSTGPSSGLIVADLTTGTVERVPLAPPLGAIVRTAQWSPDSELLGWSGQAVQLRSRGGASYRSEIIGGVITVASGRSRALPHAADGNSWDGLGVCNDGTALRYVWPVFFAQARDDVGPTRVRSWQRVRAAHGDCSTPTPYAPVGEDEHLLGWLSGATEPSAVVLRPRWTDDDEDRYDSQSLGVVTRNGSFRDVGTLDSGWVSDLTVATGLMTAERPTVPAGEPPWERPWLEENWRMLLALLAIALGGIGALVVVRARVVRR